MGKVRVIIIDDSKSICSLLKKVFESDPDIEVVGVAQDPYEARDLIKNLNPDVITLDVEMPKMNGLTFLKNLMRLHPMPVVMISSFTQAESEITLECLKHGAVDYLGKPTNQNKDDMEEFCRTAVEKVKVAAGSNISKNFALTGNSLADEKMANTLPSNTLIAIGASTGGVYTIEQLLKKLSSRMPPIVITQHLSEKFTNSFAKRLNSNLSFEIVEAQDDVQLKDNHIYIAPGKLHLEIVQKGKNLFTHLSDAAPCNMHKPSVDVMFNSMANLKSIFRIAVLLTGMGKDGAEGMSKLHGQKVPTIVQDRDTSIVWGMPKAAIDLGAADFVLPLDKIGDKIVELLVNYHRSKKQETK